MLVRMARPVYPYAMVTGFALAVMALVGLYATRHSATAVGAFAGFTYGLLIWAALEMAFLFGYVTGPRKTPCPPGLTRPQRFRAAFEAIAWHELSILIVAALLIALSVGAENRVAADVFLLLFAMRISASSTFFSARPMCRRSSCPITCGISAAISSGGA